jgi:hypothetical protein
LFCLCDFEERGIKLDEGILDRRVLTVTIITGRVGRKRGGCVFAAKVEIGPLLGEALLVLHFGFDGEEFVLIVTCVINGTLSGGRTDFKHEHGFIGPVAGLEEDPVRSGIYEDIVEARIGGISGCGGAVCHAEAGAQERPLAVIFGKGELTVGREVRPVIPGSGAGLRGEGEGREDEEQGFYGESFRTGAVG